VLKVFLAVLGALVVFSIIKWLFIGGLLWGAASAAGDGLKQQAAENARQFEAQQRANQEWRVQAARVDVYRRTLGSNQRCVGGVVLIVNGSSYTQLGTVGDPVRCNGQYADRPLR